MAALTYFGQNCNEYIQFLKCIIIFEVKNLKTLLLLETDGRHRKTTLKRK